MTNLSNTHVTTLLEQARLGGDTAQNELFRAVYDELRGIASGLMAGERRGHTLQPTAVVNEAVKRLMLNLTDLVNRRHFFAAAARAMRQVLVDYARRRNADRRGGGTPVGPLVDDPIDRQGGESVDLVALDDALREFERLSPRQAEVFQLWYFGGLSVEDMAQQLELSSRSIQVDLKAAKTWLRGQFCA